MSFFSMSFFKKNRFNFLGSLFLSILLAVVWLAPGSRTLALQTDSVPTGALTQDVRKTVLDNGLTVLTKEVHTAPVVSVQVWYRVGSRNEPAGQNGISHQLEHLMFKGTSDRPLQFGRLFSALGSQSNAFTSYDETAYFGTVERSKLNALLTLEADRMENSLIGAEQLNSERTVVISELQGYENSPRYRLSRAVMKAAFPNRAYGLPVGGTKTDVQNFSLEQVQQYYQRYYTPNNAILVVTGDFSTNEALQTIRNMFGKLEKRGNPTFTPTSAQSTPNNSQPIVLQEPGTSPLLEMVYPLPDAKHPDVPAIDLMDMVLTGGRSSRLYQTLVETGLASGVGAYPAEMIEPGWYDMTATAAPGKSLEDIQRVLDQELTRIQQQPVSMDELNRAKTQLQTSFILGNQDVSSQASQLAYNELVTGDYRQSDRYLQAVARVTPADIQRVARLYLNASKRTTGRFEPTSITGSGSGASAGRVTENFSPGKPVDPAEVARYLPPAIATADPTPQPLPETFTLPNGLRVLLLKDDSTPAVNLSGWVQAGSEFDTADKAGLANMTAINLMNGTTTKSALQLATRLEDRGADLGFSANREGVSISGSALANQLPVVIQTLADVLQNANFPGDRLEVSRQQALTSLKSALDDPNQLGRRVFQQTLYPANHPFHNFPTEVSLKAIQQTDVANFYRQHYRPSTTTLALVGDFEPAQVRSLLTQSLGNWRSTGNAPSVTYPNVSLPTTVQRMNETLPGKAEAVTYIGYSGISRNDPRFYSALLLNQILGGDTLASRLGTEIRDRQGLTYGIYSYFQAGIRSGPFVIAMQTAPENANQAIDSTLALLRQLRESGISEAELEAAKRSLTNSYPVDLSNPSDLTDSILSNAIYGLPTTELQAFPQRIEAVSLDQIQNTIRDLIHPDNLLIVTVGPATHSTR